MSQRLNPSPEAGRGDSPDHPLDGAHGPSAVDVAMARGGGALPGPETPAPRATRPPLWLILLTVAIPLTIGVVWYTNWAGRPLDAAQLAASLKSDSPRDQLHALYQFQEKVIAWGKLARDHPDSEPMLQDIRASLDPILDYAATKPAPLKLRTALANAFGFFANVADGEWRERAKRHLDELLFASDTPEALRYQVATSLTRFGERSPLVLDTLMTMLQHSDVDVRRNAAIGLSVVGTAAQAGELRRIADTDPDPVVREFADDAWQRTKDIYTP